MDVKKMVIEITKEGTTIFIDDEAIGCVQRLDLTIDAEPQTTVTAVLKLWKTIGDPEPIKIADLVQAYSGTFGAYVTPFTNKVELVTEPIVLIDEE